MGTHSPLQAEILSKRSMTFRSTRLSSTAKTWTSSEEHTGETSNETTPFVSITEKRRKKKKEGKRKRKSERRERGFPNVGGQTLNTVLECDMLCCCCCCYFYYPSVTALSHFLSPTLHNKVSFSFAKKSNLSLSKKSENLLPFFFNFIYLELRWCWRWRWDSEIHFGVWSQWPFFSDPYATK